MLFTSYGFIGFALLLFILYYSIPKKYQWILLLVFSYAFYFIANPIYLIYIAVTTVTVFRVGILIENSKTEQSTYLKEHKGEISKEEKKQYKALMKGKQWKLLLFGLLLNLAILAVVKYTNFSISNVNAVLTAFGSEKQLSFMNIIVPMGISFYTFQALSYLIDVYRGTCQAQTNVFKFALFVSFFPQLVQGPISRYGDLSQTLYEEHPFDYTNVSFGLQRILWGFFKKLVLADRVLIGLTALTSEPETYRGGYVFVVMMFYALQLYADFTGGIDVTIGVAEVLGVRVTENFHRPFFSKNIKEFWNRWHMTMGSWFTDYIFYPIAICKPMTKLAKFSRSHFGEVIGKRIPIYLSAFVVWFTTGIWHGASWSFIVWGLMNFVVIMISQELEPLYAKFHGRFNTENSTVYRGFQVVRTVLLMSSLRLFDCYHNVPLTFQMFGTLFDLSKWNIFSDGTLLNLGLSIIDYVILFVGVVIIFTVSMVQRTGKVRAKIAQLSYPARFVIWFGLFLIVVMMGIYGVGYDATQFIYNQF